MRAGPGDEGQAAVELALVLPLLALLLLGMVQVGLVVRDQVMLTHAAREAAREAAVDPSPEAVRRAALAGAPLATGRLKLEVERGPEAGRISVRLAFRAPTAVALVGPLLPDVELSARASMRSETAANTPTPPS
ncbi:MAG TPA: TadE/TadG family type IV pilus assembly protein [Acidimicrobiales bacterium]|nr:TadE/TadG family type IV pilus assembly protein [Acidimicrobiales bacterium]